MSRLFTLFAAVLLVFSSTPVFAQESEDITPFPIPMSAGDGGEASGPLNCFDWYTFGSVQADLQPSVAQTVSGVPLTFSGEVVNNNPYPLLDGTLYVKIFKRDETSFAAGDGNQVVDQFVIQDGITLPAQGKLPVSYDWKVPLNAEGGEYYAAYFFTTAKRYNLMGLSFTDDVVGNQAPFTIVSDQKIAALSKTETTLNDRNHNFAAFPLHFAAGDEVTVKTTITNPSDQPKTLPLMWSQYAWDAINEDNLRFTKTEVVTLAPNETKEVTYTVQPQRESVVYITAITQDNEAKTILDIRFVRDGIEETRINFPGLSAFPLKGGNEATLFACAHSTNLPNVPGNTLTLTLTDRDGNTIHQYKYEGDISGAMAGFGETFTPEQNINYATLTATLERNGVTVEQVTQVYDCAAIDSNSCLPEDSTTTGFFDSLKTNALTITLTLIALILLSAIAVFFYKKRHNHIDAGPTMTTPTAFLFLLFLLPSLFFLQSGVVEAKSVTWTSGGSPQLAYCWNRPFSTPAPGTDVQPRSCATTPVYGGTINWEKALNGAVATVQYSATIIDRSTGAQINDGASVTAGTQIRLQTTPHGPSDVSWFGTGFSQDSPNGEWRNNAAPPGWTSQTYGWMTPTTANGPVCDAKDLLTTRDSSTFYRVSAIHIPLVFNPPAGKSASVSNLSCGGASVDGNGTFTQDCTVTAAGPVNVTFNFPATYGKYYYRYQDEGGMTGDPFSGMFIIDSGCYGNDQALRHAWSYNSTAVNSGGLSGSDYTVDVPAQSIGFSFNATPAVPANNPPSTTITGPTSGTVNTSYSFGVRGNDPEGDTVRVGVDWNRDGTPDIGSPYGNFSPSGTTENFSYTWTAPGTYTFQANSQDSVSMGVSPWVTHTITIAAAPVITADLTINGSNGPINVAKNATVNLNWTSANAASCSKWGGTWGSGQAIPLTGSGTTVVTATTDYMINCGGVTDTVRVNVVNQTPNAPTINYVSGTKQAGQTLTFSIQGSDPDSDNVFYEVDWDNNGTVDATTMTVPSNTAQNANHSWSTVGTVTFQARTVDTAGARSGWTSHSETLAAPPPPTASLEVQVNSGGWTSSNPPAVDTNDTITLRWSSTGATSCTGTNFNTGGATSNGGMSVTTPAPGGSTTFTLSCTGLGGNDSKSITVSTGLPNFNRPIATHSLSTTFDPATGEYSYVDISFQTTNDGQSGTANTAQYSVQFDTRSPVTGTIPLLTRGATSPNFTHRITTIPFGTHTATIVVDTNNSVQETNEGDNTYVYNFGGIIPPPNPGLNITADKIQLRNNETTTIRWTTVGTYPTLSCTVVGPGMNVSPAPLSGNQTTQPITAKSEYIFTCTETTTNTTWSDSVTVETQGVIEEI